MSSNTNNKFLNLLALFKTASLMLAVALSSVAGFMLCISHYWFGAPSNLVYTAIGSLSLAGVIWVVEEGYAFRRKHGLILNAVLVLPDPDIKSRASVATGRSTPSDPERSDDHKWQTQIASDMAPRVPETAQEPRLAKPRKRIAPARIGGEWEEE